MLLVSLDCPFLIAPPVFSNVYLDVSKLRKEFLANYGTYANMSVAGKAAIYNYF
jgi:hypothetical protein